MSRANSPHYSVEYVYQLRMPGAGPSQGCWRESCPCCQECLFKVASTYLAGPLQIFPQRSQSCLSANRLQLCPRESLCPLCQGLQQRSAICALQMQPTLQAFCSEIQHACWHSIASLWHQVPS